MADIKAPTKNQSEKTRLKDKDIYSKPSQDSSEKKPNEDDFQILEDQFKDSDETQLDNPDSEVDNNIANLFANQEDLPTRPIDTPTRINSNSSAPVNSNEVKTDSDEEARLKSEQERRLKEFREKTIKDSEDIEVTEDDVIGFVDWCLGGNNFLAYDEGKGDENSNKLASQLTSAIFTRLGGTGIGMALISTGVLSWLGIIIIAFSNTPNCVMDKLKETLGDDMFGIIPLDKIPNISDKLAEYAGDTTSRVSAEVERIKNGRKKAKEILASQTSPELPKNTSTPSKDSPLTKQKNLPVGGDNIPKFTKDTHHKNPIKKHLSPTAESSIVNDTPCI